MRIIYFDCFAGASGDMLLAALLDAGAGLDTVREQLARLPLTGYELKLQRTVKRGLSALDVTVEVTEKGQPHRHFHDIEAMLTNHGLAPEVESAALKVFRRLAEAEGKIHNRPPSQVHFHEVGAVDSIVDIVGVAAALWSLGAARLISSPLHTGSGFVRCAHGLLPVPAPATLEMLTGAPVYSQGLEAELLTPTGAAILTALAEFGPLPAMTVKATGYGAGKKDLPIANIMRVILGETGVEKRFTQENVGLLEANIDNMNPELYGYVMDKLFAAGALDVTLQPVYMKKNRPGLLISVLAPDNCRQELAGILFQETTTLGIRHIRAEKMMLSRRHVTVETPYGPARVKIAEEEGKIINAAPEYEDCRLLAETQHIPLKEIYAAVMASFKLNTGTPDNKLK